jgi:hypothetical protein
VKGVQELEELEFVRKNSGKEQLLREIALAT